MARDFYTPLDLHLNEIRNPRAQNLGAAPGSAAIGQFYYDTVLNAAYFYNGAAWVAADAAKAATGSIPNSALTTNPLARSNHTGTQLSATISDLFATVTGYRLNQFAAPSANIPMNGFTLTGLATPTAAGQAAEYAWTMAQIQSAAAGIASKPPVRLVATTNQTMSGLSAIDGVTPVVGDRILLVAQTAASQNGVYIAATGAWQRAVTEDQSNELATGALWLATEGTTYAATQWRVATTGTIVVGTTNVSIVWFGAANVYTGSQGIQLTGSNFTLNLVAGGGILQSTSGAYVDTTVVARKFSQTIGDGSATSFVVTHNLGTQDVLIQVKAASAPFAVVEVDMAATSTSTVTIAFASAPAANSFRVTVLG